MMIDSHCAGRFSQFLSHTDLCCEAISEQDTCTADVAMPSAAHIAKADTGQAAIECQVFPGSSLVPVLQPAIKLAPTSCWLCHMSQLSCFIASIVFILYLPLNKFKLLTRQCVLRHICLL